MVCNQLRTTMAGVVGLDFGACQAVAVAMGFDWDETTITVLRHLEVQFLKDMAKDDGKSKN